MALRLVRLGVLVWVLGAMVVGPLGLLVTDDVRSVPVLVGVVTTFLAGAGVVWRHDWSTAIVRGRAHLHAELWAAVVLVGSVVAVMVAIPRAGSWVFFLVIAAYFALLLPPAGAARVLLASLVGVGLTEGLAAGTPLPLVLTACLGVMLAAIVAHGTADMIARVIGQSEHRARMLAIVAQSARAVASLDPDEVPRRVADAATHLGFDLVVVTEVLGDEHRVLVERSTGGPIFVDQRMPTGPRIREAIDHRRLVVRDHYLQTETPNPQLRARGVDAVVISPVVVDDDVRALLIGGRYASQLDPAQTEAFTLLGELLAQSLVNARRFEREREAVATLDELGRLKDDFISNVSHELRTPITVILGGLQTLDRRGEELPDTTRRQLFRSAVLNAESLQSTLESLLEFARAEQGRHGASDLVPVDVASVARGCVGRLASLLAEHEVQVDAPEPVEVRMLGAQLDRVLDNLLLNAARHTPAGTRVDVAVRSSGLGAHVAVVDDGPGIAREDLPHLTDRFFRGGESTTRPTRGLGLGLALAQSILVAHGSHLQVASTPGAGTRFWFELPADPER